MGQRANIVIVHEGEYSLFYNHFGGDTLASWLFWGPERVPEMVDSYTAVDADQWLNTSWAEGGALVDDQRRTLLFFSSDEGLHEILYDIRYRRVFVELMQHIWRGWTVRWAHAGMVELAEYVGVPRAQVRGKTDFLEISHLNPPKIHMRGTSRWAWVRTIGSFVFVDGSLALFPLQEDIEDYLVTGERLMELAERDRVSPTLDLDQWPVRFPTGGFHIDVAQRSLFYWWGGPWGTETPVYVDELAAHWPGWDLHPLEDQYEAHMRLTQQQLHLSAVPPQTILEEIKRVMISDTHPDTSDRIALLNNAITEWQQHGEGNDSASS
jgi:hypothetical protein